MARSNGKRVIAATPAPLTDYVIVTEGDKWTILNALIEASLRSTEYAVAMAEAVNHLRDGGEIALFPVGANGAKQAEAMQRQHEANAAEYTRLADLIEEAPSLVLDWTDKK